MDVPVSHPTIAGPRGRAVALLGLHLLDRSPDADGAGRSAVLRGTPGEVGDGIHATTRALLGNGASDWQDAVDFIRDNPQLVPQLRAQAQVSLKRDAELAAQLQALLPERPLWGGETEQSPGAAAPVSRQAYDAMESRLSGEAGVKALLHVLAGTEVNVDAVSEAHILGSRTHIGTPHITEIPPELLPAEHGVVNRVAFLARTPVQAVVEFEVETVVTAVQEAVARALIEDLQAGGPT